MFQGTLLVYKFENDKIDLFLTLKGFSKKTINQVLQILLRDKDCLTVTQPTVWSPDYCYSSMGGLYLVTATNVKFCGIYSVL